MPRLPHHSSNYGGARPGSGQKKTSTHRLTELALDIVSKSKQHPLEYLLDVMADENNSTKLRADAAQACMPYCMSRLSTTEININRESDNLSDEEIRHRLEAIHHQLLESKPKGKLINGSSRRINEENSAEVVQ